MSNNIISTLIIIIIILSCSIGAYPVLYDIVENITGLTVVGTSLVILVSSLYWIIIGIIVILILFYELGLEGMVDEFKKM